MPNTHDTESLVETFLQGPTPSYLGRVEFGAGLISAEAVSREEFEQNLLYIAKDGLVFASDFAQHFGGCMDGRGDIQDEAGNRVTPRPKVIGGPSLYAWYVAAIGNFSILEGVTDPIEQFRIVNNKLNEAGVGLGMHRECGAARGVEPVLATYDREFDGIVDLMGDRAKAFARHENGLFLNPVKDQLEVVGNAVAGNAATFNEDAMIDIIKDIQGESAVLHLAVNHDHDTHGHEEAGLVFMRVKHGVVFKDKVIQETGMQNFYQNTSYAKMITSVMARTQAELAKGIIIGDQLPLSGVATLGKSQHVGEITGQLLTA